MIATRLAVAETFCYPRRMTILPQAKKTLRSAHPAPAVKIDAASEMRRLCQLDDADGVMALLRQLGVKTDTEIAHGRTPIVFAIASDAPNVFKKLVAKDGAGRKRGLGARLYGGNTPAHLCCHIPSGFADNVAAFAPKCLAAAIAIDPLLAMRLTEDRRSTLATAATCPDPAPFEILVASLARAVSNGSVPEEAARHELSVAAARAVEHSGGTPQQCLAKLNALSIAGLDWRSIVDPATGASLLGLTLPAEGRGQRQHIGLPLLAHGADPMGSALTRDGAEVSCIEAILSDPLISILAPSLSLHALSALDGDKFSEIFAEAPQADLLRSMCSQLRSLASPLAATGALISVFDIERVSARLSKIAADKEAATLAECIPNSRRSMAPKNL